MGNYSKLIGSLVGGVLGILVSKFGLPTDWQSPEIVTAFTTILSALATFVFPANKPTA